MSAPKPENGRENPLPHPPSLRGAKGTIDLDSVPDVIQWFLDYDERVVIIRHPRVEEIFHWKQEQSRKAGDAVFDFRRAEDRLAIGIIQALGENSTERELHSWISQLINALDVASKANESVTEAYCLDVRGAVSVVSEAEKIPSERRQKDFLLNCWIEALCTAEARILGWIYREMYGQPYAP